MEIQVDPNLLFTPILDEGTNEPTGLFTDGPLYILFKEYWAHEPVWLHYMIENHLYNFWSYAWKLPGEPNTTNAMEKGHQWIKSPENLHCVDGAVTLLDQMSVAGVRLSRDAPPIATVPDVPAPVWKKAQELAGKGYCLLSWAFPQKIVQNLPDLADCVVIPSTAMIKEHMPEEATSVKDKMEFLKVWAREFMGIKKKRAGYEKFHNGSWDFDTACDMTTVRLRVTSDPPHYPHLDLHIDLDSNPEPDLDLDPKRKPNPNPYPGLLGPRANPPLPQAIRAAQGDWHLLHLHVSRIPALLPVQALSGMGPAQEGVHGPYPLLYGDRRQAQGTRRCITHQAHQGADDGFLGGPDPTMPSSGCTQGSAPSPCAQQPPPPVHVRCASAPAPVRISPRPLARQPPHPCASAPAPLCVSPRAPARQPPV